MKNDDVHDLVMVGGGLVGLATAWRFLERYPGTRVAVLEKEPTVGRHQSGHNSGVLHAGLYYRPGSEKAQLSVQGLKEMVDFCRQNGVAHEQCGKIVVATAPEEVSRLDALWERGHANGLRGLQRLDADGIREIEPHAAGLAAIRVPEEGIVDYAGVMACLVERLRDRGGDVRTSMRVESIRRDGPEWVVRSATTVFRARRVVTCAGLHSDRAVRLAGGRPRSRIIPFRGEYYRLRPDRRHLVRGLIYPVADPKFPFLGVHFTRMIDGEVEAGPNAVLAFAREGYRWTDINPMDLAGSLSYPGLWRFLLKHPRMCGYEVWRSFSRAEFCRSLQRLVPEVQPSDLSPGGSGVRAQAMHPDGRLVEDFEFETGPGILHVVNAPSPAATASLAIAGRIVDRLTAG